MMFPNYFVGPPYFLNLGRLGVPFTIGYPLSSDSVRLYKGEEKRETSLEDFVPKRYVEHFSMGGIY